MDNDRDWHDNEVDECEEEGDVSIIFLHKFLESWPAEEVIVVRKCGHILYVEHAEELSPLRVELEMDNIVLCLSFASVSKVEVEVECTMHHEAD